MHPVSDRGSNVPFLRSAGDCAPRVGRDRRARRFIPDRRGPAGATASQLSGGPATLQPRI